MAMVFTKSFGYALRGILYVAIAGEKGQRIQLDDIAKTLGLPRYFLGKVMNSVTKAGVLESGKGHKGGFSVNEGTLGTSLLRLVEITGALEPLDVCVLHFNKCSDAKPCPMHNEVRLFREKWINLLATKKVGDLLEKRNADFIQSITTNVNFIMPLSSPNKIE